MSNLLGNLPNLNREVWQDSIAQLALLICGFAIAVIILYRKTGLKLSFAILIFLLFSAIAFFLFLMIRHHEENTNKEISKDSGALTETVGLVSFAGEGSGTGAIEANATTGINNFRKGDILHIDLTFTPVIKSQENGIFRVHVEVYGTLKISGTTENSGNGSIFLNQIIKPSEWSGHISNAQSVEFVTPADNPNFIDPITLNNEIPSSEDGRLQVNIDNRFIKRIEFLGAHKLQVYFNQIHLRVD